MEAFPEVVCSETVTDDGARGWFDVWSNIGISHMRCGWICLVRKNNKEVVFDRPDAEGRPHAARDPALFYPAFRTPGLADAPVFTGRDPK